MSNDVGDDIEMPALDADDTDDEDGGGVVARRVANVDDDDDNNDDDDGGNDDGAGSSAAHGGQHQHHSRDTATSSNSSNGNTPATSSAASAADADATAAPPNDGASATMSAAAAAANAVAAVAAVAVSEQASEYQAQSIVSNIYSSAESGFAITMFKLLENVMDDKTRKAIIHQFRDECDGQALTPLVVASRNGHDKVVKILLTHFKVNLEQECRAKFDGHVVEGATALWCAAGAGHLGVVKLLIQHGANINHKTKTLSTPLRAACFDGRLDIVSYLVAHGADVNVRNAYNNSCLMISSYKGHIDVVAFLLEHGADPNEQAHCGATALHYAAECGYTEICRQLLDYGALIKKNEYGMTAIITAAERTRELVVEMFYTRPGLMLKEEKIDALELLGASFANDKDNYSLNKAFHYLMLAMEFRYEDPEEVVRKITHAPVAAYENWIESQTVQDLQAIRYNNNSIHMESLTIRERILTRKCPDVAHPVVYRGAVCADNGRFDRCESLWLHALELRQLNHLSVQRDLLRFAQVFSQMIHVGAAALRLPSVLTVLQSCIRELRINLHKFAEPGPKDDPKVVTEEYEANIITALYLCTIISKLLQAAAGGSASNSSSNSSSSPPLNGVGGVGGVGVGVAPSCPKLQKSERLASYKLVYELVAMRLTMRNGHQLLHLAVDGATPVDDFHISDVCRFPCPDTIRLLLMCGAPVNVFDFDRNTPLHVLTSTLRRSRQPNGQTVEVAEEITNIFIQAGIHLDAVNHEGLTAAEMWFASLNTAPMHALLRRHEMRETTLRCLASRCIAQHRIPYKDLVPKQLETFVELHSATKL